LFRDPPRRVTERRAAAVVFAGLDRTSLRGTTLVSVLRVTLDTNLIDSETLRRIETACEGHDVELAATTVTTRELKGTRRVVPSRAIPETAVYDESVYGSAVYAVQPVAETFIIGES